MLKLDGGAIVLILSVFIIIFVITAFSCYARNCSTVRLVSPEVSLMRLEITDVFYRFSFTNRTSFCKGLKPEVVRLAVFFISCLSTTFCVLFRVGL